MVKIINFMQLFNVNTARRTYLYKGGVGNDVQSRSVY